MTATLPISLWDRSAQEAGYSAPFAGDDIVDVAIVGGGYTGLSTALHCAQKGLRAHVLEAEQIGFGGSGRNVGLVNAAAWLPPQKLRKALGPVYGERFLQRFCRGPETVFDLIEQHQIRCEAKRGGTIHAAHAPSGLRDLQSRHAEWQRMGEPVDLLGRDAVSEMTGTRAFHGGLLDHRAGTINPLGYCRGLARAALAAGARISTGAKADRLRRDGALWRVETAQGTLSARAVVLGTNAYTGDLWPGLERSFSVIHYFQFATAPLGPEAAAILPGGQGLWDTGQIMSSLRRDAAGRLIIGSMGSVIGGAERGLSRRWAQKRLERMFPELGAVRFEQAWHGKIAMTPDHLPRIHALAENLYTPIGYNGRGITTGTLFGQAMADLLTGTDAKDLVLPLTDMAAMRFAPLQARFYSLAFAANQLLRSL